jgi:hypothetical protein
VDELGFVPFDRTGGELLFNLLAERYERRSVVVTTNLPFAEWVTIFAGDEKLTTALLDRLAHHATVITTKGKSYRMRQRQRSTPSQGQRAAEFDPSATLSRTEGDTPSGSPRNKEDITEMTRRPRKA